MFEGIIAFLQLLIAAFSEQKNHKQTEITKAFVSLYKKTTVLISNGNRILSIVRTVQGETIDSSDDRFIELGNLLIEQESLINGIQHLLERNKIETILSIKAPDIQPILLQMIKGKGPYIQMFLENWIWEDLSEEELGGNDDILSEQMPVSGFPDFENELLQLPYTEEVESANIQLQKIQELNNQLRQLLSDEFSIRELSGDL